MRYNLALIPQKTADQFIELAALFSSGADYLLGHRSHPHVTLTQFRVPKDYNVDELWIKVKEIKIEVEVEVEVEVKIQQAPSQTATETATEIELHFAHANHTLAAKHAWLALLPQYHPQVHALHKNLVALLKQNGIISITAASGKYTPHLTLARSTDLSLIEKLKKIKVDFTDTFRLAIGLSDEIGQLVEITAR